MESCWVLLSSKHQQAHQQSCTEVHRAATTESVHMIQCAPITTVLELSWPRAAICSFAHNLSGARACTNAYGS